MYKVLINVKVKENEQTKAIKFTLNQEEEDTLEEIVEFAVEQAKLNGLNLEQEIKVYSEAYKRYLLPLKLTLKQALKDLKEDQFIIHNATQFQLATSGLIKEDEQPQNKNYDPFQQALLSQKQMEEIKIYYTYKGQNKDIFIRSDATLEELRSLLIKKIQCGLINLFYAKKDLSFCQQNQTIDQIGIKKNSLIMIKDVGEQSQQLIQAPPLQAPVLVTDHSDKIPQNNQPEQKQDVMQVNEQKSNSYNLFEKQIQELKHQPQKQKVPDTWRIHVQIIDGPKISSAYFDLNPNANLEDLAQALHSYLSLDSKYGQVDLILGKELYNNPNKRSKTLQQLQLYDDYCLQAKVRWIGGQ